MTPTDLVVFVGATMRTTRLAMTDTITEPARNAIARRAEAGSIPAAWAETLLSCPWCTSMWAAAAVGAGALVLPSRYWRAGAAALTAAEVTGRVFAHQ